VMLVEFGCVETCPVDPDRPHHHWQSALLGLWMC